MSSLGAYTVLMPIYEDWESAWILVQRVHQALRGRVARVDFLLVDDGSSILAPEKLPLPPDPACTVEVLHLRRNLGHQRAIAIGLSHLHSARTCDGIFVMDGDGEDSPEGVALLLERFETLERKRSVFAQRARRTEGIVFKVFYQLFRLLHWMLTGRGVRVGNFSVIPFSHLERLVAVSELWNHYAAAVFRSRLPLDLLPIDRGHRIAGQSRMNFTALLAHGLSAISVFSDEVGLRLLMFAGVLGALAIVGIIVATCIKFFTTLAIPGWATTVAGTLLVVVLQALLMAVVFVLLILQGRQQHGFLPIRDFRYFVHHVATIETHAE